MLALSRKRDEAIVLDNGVRIEVIKVSGKRVTLGVHAPRDVRILREELTLSADLDAGVIQSAKTSPHEMACVGTSPT